MHHTSGNEHHYNGCYRDKAYAETVFVSLTGASCEVGFRTAVMLNDSGAYTEIKEIIFVAGR